MRIARVYTEVLPRSPTVLALVFTELAGDEDVALDGPTGTRSRRVQVDVWAETRAEERSRPVEVAQRFAPAHMK